MQYKIKSVRLKNFKCFDSSKYYEFILDDKRNPIILSGPNGFGKTTFFDAIELIFANRITRFNEAIEKGNTNLQKNILLNEANSDGYLICTLINDKQEYLSLIAKIDHNMRKVAYSDSITYGIIADNITTDNLDKTISDYNDWRNSITAFNTIKYSKENFSIYYYVSQAESVHFLKHTITERKDTMNALLDLGDVDSWVNFLQDKLIGKNINSPSVIINDEIKLLDSKINDDIEELKSFMITDDAYKKHDFFHIVINKEIDNIPFWDSEVLDNIEIVELEKGLRDIERMSHLVKDYEDYKNYLFNKKIDDAQISGTDDYILCKDYIENEKISLDKIKETINSRNRIIDIFNNSAFLRTNEIIPEKYSIEGMKKLRQLFPECVLFDIEKVGNECAKLAEMGKSLSNKQNVIKKLETARSTLQEANNEFNENSDKCPYCGHVYEGSKKLKEAYEAAHLLLKKENGNELNNYNELVKQVEESIKESKVVLNNEIGNLDNEGISIALHEVNQLSSFISDGNRINNVEFLIPLAKIDISFEDMDNHEQKVELQRMFIASKRTFINNDFTDNLTTYDYDSLLKDYPTIAWDEQKNLLNENMIDSKTSYIKAAINLRKNENANKINSRIKENIRKWQCLKAVREDLVEMKSIYSDSIESYKNQILKKLRVPLLIYTGKVLQDYQNGLGVFISKDEMRFVTNGDIKHDILNTFSSGQLSGFVLAFLFSMNKQYVKESEDDLGFLLIDDPVQTMDDINVLSMIEVLRNDFKDKQIILSTHETDKENFILYKFFKYNKIGQSFNVKDQLYKV